MLTVLELRSESVNINANLYNNIAFSEEMVYMHATTTAHATVIMYTVGHRSVQCIAINSIRLLN